MDKEQLHNNQFLKERIQPKNPFKTPENYLDNLSERLHTTPFVDSLPKKTGFNTPTNYLENFSVPQPKSKVKKLIPYFAVAASFLLGLFLTKNNTSITLEQINKNDVINYLAIEEDIDFNEILTNIENSEDIFVYTQLSNTQPTLDQIAVELSEYDIIDY